MPDRIEWLRDDSECDFAIRYLEKWTSEVELNCIERASDQSSRTTDVRRMAETWVHALKENGHSEILTRLQGNVRQHRLQKTGRTRRFNLTEQACKALDQLVDTYGKPPSETISELLTNTPNALAEAEKKWMDEHKGKIEHWTYDHLAVKDRLKRTEHEMDGLHEQLRLHIRALMMWKVSMDSDTPPFEGEPEQLDDQVDKELKSIRQKVKKQARVLSSIPD
tara:strand:- start:166 stop:831 length:666 start_codon:yes stop_codon:yes gene_type:complete